MPKAWAISGVDLHVTVTATKVRAGLEDGLREAVRTGRLPAGTRLPSSRQLAADLGLARNTVAEAYGQLVAEGWLVARQGSGTTVATRAVSPATPPISSDAVRPPRYDLRAGLPTLTAFPVSAWVAALRRGLLRAPADALGYGDPRGRAELRNALAGYLARARGVRADPQRIVICSGFGQGLAMLADVLRARGDRLVATEGYGHRAHRRILTSRGLATRPLGVDAGGADVDRVAPARAVLLTAAHQFPLGPALAPGRRTAITSWAADSGGLVIEDDYDGEFRYDRHPTGAVQALAPEHVAYLGTASKTLAPGLRMGWMVLPGALIDEVVDAKASADVHAATLDQLALADLISGGGYDRHVRRCRHFYRRRRDLLQRTLAEHAPGCAITGIAAGLHAVVTLPDGRPEAEVVERAARHHELSLEGLEDYRDDDLPAAATQPPALVVGYATPPDHAYTGALARLTAVLTA